MKKEVYEAYEIYRDLIKRGPNLEEMTKEEKAAYIFITRDRKFMQVLDSFPKGVEPSLVDIVPKYNALIDEAGKEQSIEEKQETPQESLNQPTSQITEQTRRRKMSQKLVNAPAGKINQIGYANIVLMSIIVIIIVAIICVFIFL